ncbi:MAG: hypothetical protein AAGE92_14060, partial [Cyanobacteria bacterium P01_G01_bin.4]
ETDSTTQDAQRLLATMMGQLHPSQDFPVLEDQDADLAEWQQAWSETLIQYNHAFSQALSLMGISFPITVTTEDHPEFSDMHSLHQETYLEEWLTDLTGYA